MQTRLYGFTVDSIDYNCDGAWQIFHLPSRVRITVALQSSDSVLDRRISRFYFRENRAPCRSLFAALRSSNRTAHEAACVALIAVLCPSHVDGDGGCVSLYFVAAARSLFACIQYCEYLSTIHSFVRAFVRSSLEISCQAWRRIIARRLTH